MKEETSPAVQEGLESEDGVLIVQDNSPVEDSPVTSTSDEQEQIEYDDEAQLLLEEGQKKEEQTASRIKRKEEQRLAEEEEKERQSYPYKRERIRLIPIWLRLIIIAVLGGAALMAGLIIGFGVIGDGDNLWDVLNPELWYGIIDTIRGD
ncbi:DNA-directed RNA polymerase subunit beta [Bacillus sp. JCM 19041]|uniref:DNA-directed RNA polymerase subunit beta n=1 Tax=Bacillus sp. JCM 19041 TaxID=1460637 RepID=UPI00336AAAF4